jgi:hypothetical protein
MSIILATQRQRSEDWGLRPAQAKIVLKNLSFPTPTKKKKKSQKRAGGVAQGVGPEFKLQHHEKNKNKT